MVLLLTYRARSRLLRSRHLNKNPGYEDINIVVLISGVRWYKYLNIFMNIQGTRIRISGVRGYEGRDIWVRGYEYPGYEGTRVWISGVGMNIRGTRERISGIRGYEYPGYEGMNIWARGYEYPGYEGTNIRGTRVWISKYTYQEITLI